MTAQVTTTGWINEAEIRGDSAHLTGWAVSAAGIVDSFRFTCRGRTLYPSRVVTRLSSPDIVEYFPRGLEGVPREQLGRCRFRFLIPLSQLEDGCPPTSLVEVTPLVGRRPGQVLVGIPQPHLPFPPDEYVKYIGGCYHNAAGVVAGHIIHWSDLKPHESVLDIGCGVGRAAHGLAHYLVPPARYEGFDVAAPLIRWAQQNITKRFPNFNFRWVDVYNGTCYHPQGSIKPTEFTFPYPNESFDLVFSISVFTHMFWKDVGRYLDECQRVLRPGGRCFHSCFMLDDEARRLIQNGKTMRTIIHPVDEVSFTDTPEAPEVCIGFAEPFVREQVAKRGFAVRHKIPGWWSGRAAPWEQDVLVLEKQPPRQTWAFWKRAA